MQCLGLEKKEVLNSLRHHLVVAGDSRRTLEEDVILDPETYSEDSHQG